jgi:hypothetical protein
MRATCLAYILKVASNFEESSKNKVTLYCITENREHRSLKWTESIRLVAYMLGS